MNRLFLYIVLAFIVVASVAFKNWQCSEMFPDASRVACIMWK